MKDDCMKPLYISRAGHIAADMPGGQMMIMSTADFSLYVLNGTASIIWQAADGITSLSEIVFNKVCAEFDVAPDVALEDATTLVNSLAGHGILLISDQPARSLRSKVAPNEHADAGNGGEGGPARSAP
jgi:hypothetical protein